MPKVSYIVMGAVLIAAAVYIRLAETPGPSSVETSAGIAAPSEVCYRSNSSGSGEIPCSFSVADSKVTFSFSDAPDVVFHVKDRVKNTYEVTAVQVQGSGIEPSFGFCDVIGHVAICEASNGTEMVEYRTQ